MQGMMDGWMGLSSLWLLLGLIGLISLSIWVVRLSFPQDEPMDSARQRLARGDISVEEFERLEARLKPKAEHE